MTAIHKAKLFDNGSTQTVVLPHGFRLASEEVFVSRDDEDNIILSDKPGSELPGAKVWEEFFAFARTVDVPKDWMVERPLNQITLEPEPPLFTEDD